MVGRPPSVSELDAILDLAAVAVRVVNERGVRK
jgi:hypothetical protein